MQEKPNFNFDDEEQVSKYVQGPPKFVPGYSTVHRMVHQLFCEVVNKDANILVLGAGGGLELKAFSDAASEWTFSGVAHVESSKEIFRRKRTTCRMD